MFLDCNQINAHVNHDKSKMARWCILQILQTKWACSSVQNCMQALTCSLLWRCILGLVEDVDNDNHIECLALHLSNITLNSYRGTPPKITLAMFFLTRAKVLRVLRLNTHLIRKDQWYDYQSRQVLRNGSASKNAKLRIGRAYGKAIGSHCVEAIHDLSAADP